MNAAAINYIEDLEEHIKVADIYISSLENKSFKWPRDRNAIKYWKAYKAGIKRAIYLSGIYLEVKKNDI